jgi:hypothetical protein
MPFEYVSNPTGGGQPYLQGPPLVTAEGAIYSSYVDVHPTTMTELQLRSELASMREAGAFDNQEQHEPPNIIRNENTDDENEGLDLEGALNTSSLNQTRAQQRDTIMRADRSPMSLLDFDT